MESMAGRFAGWYDGLETLPMNSTLIHGLRLLEHLAVLDGPATVSRLAAELGLARSQTHRLLQSLKGGGYVVQEPDRRYRIGLRPLRITAGIMTSHPLRRAALPFLRRVSEATGCDAVLSVLHADQALVIATDHPQGSQLDAFNVLGQAAPLHAWANGKVLLAYLPLVEQEALLGRLTLTRYTERTRTTRAALEGELLAVRERGWALNDRENQADVLSVSVPLSDAFHRCLAAFGASWSPGKQPDTAEIERVVGVLRTCAAALTRNLAGLPPRPASSGTT